MRIRIWWVLVTLALLWGGGQTLYTALRNREPTRLPCSALLEAAPQAEWLRLEGCVLNLGNTGYTNSKDEVFIAVEPPGAGDGTQVRIVLASKEPATIQLATTPPTSFAALKPPRDVEGLAQFGIDLKDSRKKAIAGVIDHLAPDFVILREGERPNALLGGGMFLGGLVFLAFVLRRLLGRQP